MEIRNQVSFYRTENGEVPFKKALLAIRDRQAVMRINQRIMRMENGNLGDCKSVGNGVFEARIDYGPGYRVYYSLLGRQVIVLYVAGEKSTQQADIEFSKQCKKDAEARYTYGSNLPYCSL